MSNVTDKAMIAHCHLKCWGGHRQDKAVQAFVASQFGSDSERAKVWKQLCVCPELAAIKTIQGKIRSLFYHYTSPWLDNGGRILSTQLWLPLTSEARPLNDEHDLAVTAFQKVYPDIVELDKKALNGMWKAEDYPPVGLITSRFKVKLVFSPLPKVDDFRVNMAKENVDQIKSDLQESLADSHAAMMTDILNRLLKPVKEMASKLGEPGKIFRDSLVFNLVEMTEFLPKLNYTDNPEITALIEEVTQKLCSVAPDTLRESEQVRGLVVEEASDLAADIAAKMSGYM